MKYKKFAITLHCMIPSPHPQLLIKVTTSLIPEDAEPPEIRCDSRERTGHLLPTLRSDSWLSSWVWSFSRSKVVKDFWEAFSLVLGGLVLSVMFWLGVPVMRPSGKYRYAILSPKRNQLHLIHSKFSVQCAHCTTINHKHSSHFALLYLFTFLMIEIYFFQFTCEYQVEWIMPIICNK